MSTYVREKVLRVPFNTIFPIDVCEWVESDDFQDDAGYFLKQKFEGLIDYGEENKFQIAPTEESYIDFVLEREKDCDGEYGKVRDLYDSERERFLPVFQKLNPKFTVEDMNKVRLVEFCWYNCTEAPNYYDIENDSFYKEMMYNG